MRQYSVSLMGQTFAVEAEDGMRARVEGVKLFRLENPGKYPFAYLLSKAHAHLVNPKMSGRHSKYNWDLF